MELININGVMGTGKSTLAKEIANKYKYQVFEEETDTNFSYTLLPTFLKLKAKYEQTGNHDYWIEGNRLLYHIQNFVFQSQYVKFQKALTLSSQGKGTVFVSHPIALHFLYTIPYYRLGWLTEEQFFELDQLVLDIPYPSPCLMVNLFASVPTILERKQMKGRENEESNNEKFISESLKLFSTFAFQDFSKLEATKHLRALHIDCSHSSPKEAFSEFDKVFQTLKR